MSLENRPSHESFNNDRSPKLFQERLLHGIEKTSHISLNGYYYSKTRLRCLKDTKRLSKWEQWYAQEYPEKGDLHQAKTHRKLRKEGITQRDIFADYLQSKIVSKKLLHGLADQATTEANRQDWLTFDKDVRERVEEWIDNRYPQTVSSGIAKGMLSALPQNPELARELIIGGAAADCVSGMIDAEGAIGNHLFRMGNEFAILLKAHYLSHAGPLANFTALQHSQIDDFSSRIFHGSRLYFESETVKAETKAIAAGVSIAQVSQALQSESLPIALTHLLIPAGVAGYLYHKIYKEKGGKAAEEYLAEQADLLEEAAEISKDIAAQGGGKNVSANLEGTTLPKKRHTLTNRIRKSNREIEVPFRAAPWAIAGAAAAGTEDLLDLLVTGGITVAALNPLKEEPTRQRHIAVHTQEVKKLAYMVDAINFSTYCIPTSQDIKVAREALGLPVITDKAEAFSKMKGSLYIHSLSGDRFSTVKAKEEKKPIELKPGISYLTAPSGFGKNIFIRMLALEEGNAQELHIMKGEVDLRQLELDNLDMQDIIYIAGDRLLPVERTMADQMAAFLSDPDENKLKQELRKMQGKDQFQLYRYLFSDHLDDIAPPDTQGEFDNLYSDRKSRGWYRDFPYIQFDTPEARAQRNAVIDILLSDDPKKEELVTQWIANPHVQSNVLHEDIFNKRPDDVISRAVLTIAFYNIASKFFNNIRSPHDAAKYLERKPDIQGVSSGETAIWQTLKALFKKRAIIILDEPTSRLEKETTRQGELPAYMNISSEIRQYIKEHPDTVILIVEHNKELIANLYGESQLLESAGEEPFVDKILSPIGLERPVLKAAPVTWDLVA